MKYTKMFIYTLAVMLALVFNSNSLLAQELVANGDFETGSLSPWTSSGQVSVVADQAYEGTHSVQVSWSSVGSTSVEQVVTVQPNTTYGLSAFAKISTVGDYLLLGVKDYGDSQLTTTFTQQQYEQKGLEFTTGSTNTTATIFLYRPPGSGTGNTYVDAVSMSNVFQLTSSPIREVEVGKPYSYQIIVTQNSPVTTVVDKPNWLSFDAQTLTLTGTPTVRALNQNVHIRLISNNKTIDHEFKVSAIRLNEAPKIIASYLDPTQYPEYQRRRYPTPTWSDFNNKVQFVAGRYIPVRKWENVDAPKFGPPGDRPVAPRWWTGRGTVFRPGIDWFLGLKNDASMDTGFLTSLTRMQQQGIYVFNVGGYGPGTPKFGSFGMHYQPEDYNALLQQYLGNKWLGFDVGEQDGRYLNIQNNLNRVNNPDRFQQYLNIHRFTSKVGSDQGDKLVLLTVAWNWHHPAKNNNVYMLGAESQAKTTVTSSPINYMMLRGASRQYGIPLFGDVSVFSTTGSKAYGDVSGSAGPIKGGSLNLMRRLMVSEYLYGSAILGFEGSLFNEGFSTNQITTPIAELHQQMFDFVEQDQRAGVMHAPVAVLQDFMAGWIPKGNISPINNTTTSGTSTWGAIPWNSGDWQTHRVISKLYPNYDQNGLGTKELGGYCNTPYGDMADGLLTDVTSEILNQYGLVVATSLFENVDAELKDKVNTYVQQGGNFVVSARNAVQLFPDWFTNNASYTSINNPTISFYEEPNWVSFTEQGAFILKEDLNLPPHQVIAYSWINGIQKTVVAKIDIGSGSVWLDLSEYGVVTNSSSPNMLYHYNLLLNQEFKKQRLFHLDNVNLGYITNRLDETTYTVGIFNNGLSQQSFSIKPNIGHSEDIESITELDLTAGRTHPKNLHGYWPEHHQGNNGGTSSASTIMGGDVRLFKVKMKAVTNLTIEVEDPDVGDFPAGRYLYRPDLEGLEENILKWETMLQHFEGVMIDWTALTIKDEVQLKRSANWLNLQNLKVMVDFSRDFEDHLQSLAQQGGNTAVQNLMEGTFIKMKEVFGENATNVVVKVETTGSTGNQLLTALGTIADWAAAEGINLHLYPGTSTDNNAVLAQVNTLSTTRQNVFFLLDTSTTPPVNGGIHGAITTAGDKLGSVIIKAEATQKNYEPLQDLEGSVIQVIYDNFDNWEDIYENVKDIYQEDDPVSLTEGVNKPELVDPIEATVTGNRKVHPNNANHYLAFREIQDLKRAIMDIEGTFFDFFGGVMIEAKYLANRADTYIANDKRWLDSKGIDVIVDFSQEINGFPGITLYQYTSSSDNESNVRNTQLSNDYIDRVLDKAQQIGAHHVIVGGHNGPELANSTTVAGLNQSDGIKRLVIQAQTHGINVHYQHNEFNNSETGGDNSGDYSTIYNRADHVQNIVNTWRNEGLDHVYFAANSINSNDLKLWQPLGAIIVGGSKETDRRVPIPISHDTEINVSGLSIYTNTPIILDGGYEVNKHIFGALVDGDANYLWGTRYNKTNVPPNITSTPQTTVIEGGSYNYTLTATDSNSGDQLEYSAVILPSWLSFDTNTKVLSGTAPGNAAGNAYLVKLRVFDGTIDVEQRFTITVTSGAQKSTLEKKEIIDHIEIYPNPSEGIITLDYPLDLPKLKTINVYDLSGRLLQSIEEPMSQGTQAMKVDLGKHQTKGLYLIELVDAVGTETSYKVFLK